MTILNWNKIIRVRLRSELREDNTPEHNCNKNQFRRGLFLIDRLRQWPKLFVISLFYLLSQNFPEKLKIEILAGDLTSKH